MSQKRILIIDDDPDVLLSAAMFLEELGYEVTRLSDTDQILPAMKASSYEVIQWLENVKQPTKQNHHANHHPPDEIQRDDDIPDSSPDGMCS